MAYLKYWDWPKSLQDKLDGSDFLVGIQRIKFEGKTAYRATYEDSFEVWTTVFDGNGNEIAASGFVQKESMA
jgi:hypothetical protein